MAGHRKHKFVGELEGKALAAWLNAKGHAREREKVSEIIAALRSLNDSDGTVTELFRKRVQNAQDAGHRRISFSWSDFNPTAHYLTVSRRLDRLLARCWMRPRIVEHDKPGTHHDGPGIVFGWVYRPKRSEGIHLLMQLIAMNLGDRIRVCEKTGCCQWFFAKFPHEKFCSEQCGTRSRQSSDARKEKRREWYKTRKVLKNTTKLPQASRV